MSSERAEVIELVNESRASGARQSMACEIMGISAKTLQRWKQDGNAQDGRIDAKHEPANKLTAMEKQRLIQTANKPEYADLPPGKIVPKLADKGVYIASESTFYRVLKAANQQHHRQKAKPDRQIKKPRALTATGPNQIFTWDITYLPTQVKGIFLYLYLVMDIYSRKIVGWQVHEEESSTLASSLMTDICQREGIMPNQVTLHYEAHANTFIVGVLFYNFTPDGIRVKCQSIIDINRNNIGNLGTNTIHFITGFAQHIDIHRWTNYGRLPDS